MQHSTREAWLHAAVEALRPRFEWRVPERVQVSVGFPKGSHGKGKAIGQCWPSSAAADGLHHIFISPELCEVASPMGVLATLVHELVHAAVGCECGHRAPFRKLAVKVGLEGKMTSTHAGPDLVVRLNGLADELGGYPHGALTAQARKKQGTRMLKAMPPCCGYTIRLTRQWAEQGLPVCGLHGEGFELVGADESGEGE